MGPAAGGIRRDDDRARLVDRLGYELDDQALLDHAFNHRSWCAAHPEDPSNERLEFLGDAVIDLVVADLLFDAHPEWNEGDLTRARRGLVNNRNLAGYARDMDLGRFVRLGRGERRAGGAERERLLGNLFEAVVGALYLDGGLAAATAFLRETCGSDLSAEGELPAAAAARSRASNASSGEAFALQAATVSGLRPLSGEALLRS